MFNRRHYELISETIREERSATRAVDPHGLVKDALDSLAWRFADKFADDNAGFDADRFFNATVEGVVRRPRKTSNE